MQLLIPVTSECSTGERCNNNNNNDDNNDDDEGLSYIVIPGMKTLTTGSTGERCNNNNDNNNDDDDGLSYIVIPGTKTRVADGGMGGGGGGAAAVTIVRTCLRQFCVGLNQDVSPSSKYEPFMTSRGNDWSL